MGLLSTTRCYRNQVREGWYVGNTSAIRNSGKTVNAFLTRATTPFIVKSTIDIAYFNYSGFIPVTTRLDSMSVPLALEMDDIVK